MKNLKIAFSIAIVLLLSSCASSYKTINPPHLNYNSNDTKNGITLEYKYDLLNKKYAKKEIKNRTKVLAVKITNNSNQDVVFGQDIKLEYENKKRSIYLRIKRPTPF